MKYLLFFALFIPSNLFAVTPFRPDSDGQIQFASTTVNNEIAFTQQEHLALVAKYTAMGGTTTVNIVRVIPTPDEVRISTTISAPIAGLRVKWTRQEFIDAQTRTGLLKKYSQIKALIDSLADLNDRRDDSDSRKSGLLEVYQRTPEASAAQVTP